MSTTLAMAAIVLFPFACLAAVDPPFEVEEITASELDFEDDVFEYVVLPPEKIEPGKKYPLVFFLHGAGERGDDPEKVLAHFPTLMATPEYRKRFPCYLVCPQCREGMRWVDLDWSDKNSARMHDEPSDMMKVATQILDRSIKEYPIDKDRIYLTGLSMGGYGSWDLAIRRPKMFAAVVPICGGGDETKVGALVDVPLWAAHGSADPVVPVERTRRMIEALKKAGGHPRYTEFEGVGHDSWTPAYSDPDGIMTWMFEQRLPDKK